MKWRTDEPIEEVIVAQLSADFCGGKERYALLYLATKPYKHYYEDGEEIPYGAIERWTSLEDEEPVSEDLEEAAIEICSKVLKGEAVIIDGYEYVVFSDAEECFKAGAKWQKEQMMKDAVECEVDKDYYIKISDETWIDLDPSMQLKPAFGLKKGDKVKMMVIKEE